MLEPRLGGDTLDFIQSSTGGGLEVGLTLLVNEVSTLSKEMALVLDDFQVLEDPAALQGFDFLLKYLPANLHLLIASRSEPKLDLAHFCAPRAGWSNWARMSCASQGRRWRDTSTQTVGWQLSPETVRALEERTDGWITSLQMAAISLENQADPDDLVGQSAR